MADSLKTRVGRVIAGSVHALVDRLENHAPEAVMEQSIREVEAVISEVRHEPGARERQPPPGAAAARQAQWTAHGHRAPGAHRAGCGPGGSRARRSGAAAGYRGAASGARVRPGGTRPQGRGASRATSPPCWANSARWQRHSTSSSAAGRLRSPRRPPPPRSPPPGRTGWNRRPAPSTGCTSAIRALRPARQAQPWNRRRT